MSHPLDSARERLKRAEENIEYLNSEITDFLAPVPATTFAFDVDAQKPIITDENRESWERLVEFITTNTVQPRFSVLAGEIIHHLRASFDHLSWQLSSPTFQTNFPHQIEFPVFPKRSQLCGIKKSEICRYCRKIEGISSPTALARIESLQPYNGIEPTRHPLWIVHDMDRTDKHRELVLAVYIMRLNVTGKALITGHMQQFPWEIKPRIVRLSGPPQVEVKANMSAQVTFRDFGKADDEPIIPTLQNLLRFTADAIESFTEEFI